MHDRIDEVVNFDLPTQSERQTMLYHYLVKYCQPPATQWEKLQFIYRYPRSIYTGKKLIRMEGITHEVIERISRESEGFSGRSIMKMVVAWHDAAFTTPDLLLTPEILDRVLEKFKLQQKLKSTWSKQEALLYEKMIDLEPTMQGHSAASEQASAEREKEADELLQKISGQRIKLKDIRDKKTEEPAVTDKA